jgi:hypothetical protein
MDGFLSPTISTPKNVIRWRFSYTVDLKELGMMIGD